MEKMADSKDELKPVRCGCGGEAKADWTVINGAFMAGVVCLKCWIKTAPVWDRDDKDKAIAEAIKAWNRAMGAERGFDEWCDDCKEYDQDKHCCPRWNRVIKRAVAEVRTNAEPERKKGEWIEYPDCLRYEGAYADDQIVCSECHHVFNILDNCTEEFDFCPHCGADMRGE